MECVLESVQGQVHWFLAHWLLSSLDDTKCLLLLHLKVGCFSLVFKLLLAMILLWSSQCRLARLISTNAAGTHS